MDFTFYPDREKAEPVYMQLYEVLKQAIRGGTITKGEKLPSIREASAALGISRTTVENAYFQLLTEGYVQSRPKSGYYASDLKETEGAFSGLFEEASPGRSGGFISREMNFFNEAVDRESFDAGAWKRLYAAVFREREEALFTSGSHQGEPELLREISRFVNLTRGARSEPNRIVVGAGVQSLLGILAGLLEERPVRAAFEEPGYEKARFVFQDYGFETVSVPVREEGIDLKRLSDSGARIVYVSPSHQYPTGFLMPVSKRLELLAWAREQEALVVEDDYDSLIRHESRPVPCLQGLDTHDRVIYMGSFSKILLPSLRISYMVLPRHLVETYQRVGRRYSQSASKLEQLALASFLESGLMDKHLRRIKRAYKRKILLLKEVMETRYRGKVAVLSADSGLHMVLGLATEKSAETVTGLFNRKGLAVQVLGRRNGRLVVSMPYSGFPERRLQALLVREEPEGDDWLETFLV